MTNYDYKRIERMLLELLDALRVVFGQSEREEVEEFIDAGEYGIALETLVDIVCEEDKAIGADAVEIVRDVAVIMGLNGKDFEDKLSDHIIGAK